MNWKGFGSVVVVSYSMCCADIFMEGVRKTTKTG
jgi:hypothetical protein